MELTQGKVSNYVGQIKNDKKLHDYCISVDKDLQNVWERLKVIIAFFPGNNFDDINIGSMSLGTAASAPGDVTISSTNIVVKGFDGNVTTEQLYGTVEVVHSYQEGSNLTPHVHWMPTTNGTGNVKWQLEYCISQKTGSSIVTSTTLTVNSSSNGIAWESIFAEFPIISGTNISIGDQISFRFFRNPSDLADTYGSDAAINTIGFHFKQNTLGSETATAK